MCQFTPSAGAKVSVTGAYPPLPRLPLTSRFPSCCQPPSPVPRTLLRRYVGCAPGWTPCLLSGPPPPPSAPPPCFPGLGVALVTITTTTQSKPCSSLHQSSHLWTPSPIFIPSSQIKQKQFASPSSTTFDRRTHCCPQAVSPISFVGRTYPFRKQTFLPPLLNPK